MVMTSTATLRRRDAEDRDRAALEKIGKSTILERKFSTLSVLGFSCTVLATWEATLVSTFTWGLQNGGPAGSIYGYIFVWAGTFCTFASLSELASMAPTSGGQYHWVAMLAPRSSRKFLSYLEGWLTICGWQGSLVAACNFIATTILSLGKAAHADFEVSPWRVTLLSWAILLWTVFVNLYAKMLLPRFENVMLVLHILGFFAVFITLLVLGEKQSAKEVFTTFINEGNWPSDGLSFFVGTLGSAFAFVGADAAFHMAEEIHNAPVYVPLSVMLSIAINGVLGFALLLACQFVASDLNAILSSPSGWPFIGLFMQVTKSIGGTAALSSIAFAMGFATSAGTMATASRQLWAFSRDHGVPGWRTVARVDPRTSVPMHAVLITATVTILLSLINFGSSIALNAFLSIGTVGLFASYLLAASLLLYRRCTGAIASESAASPSTSDQDDNDAQNEITNTIGHRLVWGPWHMRGAVGIIVNALACAYLVIVVVFLFWPTATPVTPASMNWSCVVVGGVLIGATLYYFVRARHDYEGPRIDLVPPQRPEGAVLVEKGVVYSHRPVDL